VATPTKTLSYHKFLIAKRLAVWWLKHNGASLLIAKANKKIFLLFTPSTLSDDGVFLLFLFKAVACFSNLVLARNSFAVCARKSVIMKAFYGLCPNPQPFKKG
jgi:hypothetical protein